RRPERPAREVGLRARYVAGRQRRRLALQEETQTTQEPKASPPGSDLEVLDHGQVDGTEFLPRKRGPLSRSASLSPPRSERESSRIAFHLRRRPRERRLYSSRPRT